MSLYSKNLELKNNNLLILNPMSRNGTSLIYQLLYNHSEICFFPARIQIGCSDPAGWPFIEFNSEKTEDFFDKLVRKTTIPFNLDNDTIWYNLNIDLVENVQSINLKKIKSEFLKKAKNLGDVVNFQNLKIFINLFIETFIFSISEKNNYNLNESKYTLLHDDHLYNFGVEPFLNLYPRAHFLHIVRNSKDIIASRKNMLLHHNKFTGNPSLLKLKDTVLISELRRTIWNFIAAHLNHKKNKSNYHLMKFENLRGPERGTIMKNLSLKLGITYDDNLIHETKKTETLFTNELLFADSSLNKITGGKLSKKINSFRVSLNNKELSVIDKFIENFTGYFSENIVHNQLINELDYYYEYNYENIMKDKVLSNFLTLYNQKNYRKLFIEYSKLNYGGSMAYKSFE